MLETSARLLQLLSLLQARPNWTGRELADRLEVTTRTVRNDVDRLRRLGYPVDAAPGATGGYRLGAGAHLPPLLLDDDEAVAVAVGLRTAAGRGVTGIEESSLRALAKLEQVLPSRLRRRVGALQAYTVPFGSWGPTRRRRDAERDRRRVPGRGAPALRLSHARRHAEPAPRGAAPARAHRPALVPRRVGLPSRGLAQLPRGPGRAARCRPTGASSHASRPTATPPRSSRERSPRSATPIRPASSSTLRSRPSPSACRTPSARSSASTTAAACCARAPTGSAAWRSTSPTSASTSRWSIRPSSPRTCASSRSGSPAPVE